MRQRKTPAMSKYGYELIAEALRISRPAEEGTEAFTAWLNAVNAISNALGKDNPAFLAYRFHEWTRKG